MAMMKQRRKWALRVLLSLGLLVIGCVAFFFTLPAMLIAPASEAKSDVILHGAISKHSTADKYVIDLYRRGVARKIVCASSQISWELYPGDYARDSLISQGLPAEDVISLRLPIAPCGRMNLTKIVEFVKANGWKSVLYVTNPEDSRYLNNMARRSLEIDGVTITVSYSPEDRNELTQDWWRAHWKTQRIFGEAMVVILDRFYSECR
jgi:uncharacterized SAM-binding protein YcdF (DUF218 family)